MFKESGIPNQTELIAAPSQEPTATETPEEQTMRLESIWETYTKEVSQDPELMALISRKEVFESEHKPQDILAEHHYPPRSSIGELQFEKWKPELNPKFIKDGKMIVLRGDYQGIERKGLYSYAYAYLKRTTKMLTEELRSPQDANLLLYGEKWREKELSTSNIADELANNQSAVGRSSFISTTTNIPCAQAGTGNQATEEERSQYHIYVIGVPTDSIVNRPKEIDLYGLDEEEYLVPDTISPNEIIAHFPNNQPEELFQYLHDLLGVSKEDLGLSSENEA
ncbi:MAG: hypothetical protein K0S20_224 [Patescibacteria group bacterium]|jgi:hypothetical protein|nr:hypothetical protein [Patescibacteria group bacterium]